MTKNDEVLTGNNVESPSKQVRPEMAITNLAILILIVLTLLLAAFIGTFGFGEIGIQVFLAACPLLFVAWAYILDRFLKLRTALYTIGPEAICATLGTFSKRERIIPLGYVRDISSKTGPIQWFFGTSDLQVTVTNGDSIVLTNVRNAPEYKNMLRSLVVSYGPQRRTINPS